MPKAKPIDVEAWLHSKPWSAAHKDQLAFGQRLADTVAAAVGSWTFIIVQTAFVVVWIVFNTVELVTHKWDPYPFIMLNLLFSTQAAYSSPIIMMSQNRSSERDRFQADADFKTNLESKKDIEDLQIQLSHIDENMQFQLSRIENEKLDRILAILAEPDHHA